MLNIKESKSILKATISCLKEQADGICTAYINCKKCKYYYVKGTLYNQIEALELALKLIQNYEKEQQ